MKKILPLLLLCMVLTGCGTPKKTSSTIFAMDTVMTLTVYDSGETAENALSACRETIYDLSGKLSVTDPDSEIYQLNHSGSTTLSEDSCALLAEAVSLAGATEGFYDPTVYPLMELWGFYNDEFSVPTEKNIQEALSHTGYHLLGSPSEDGTLSLREGMGIDFGGIAKGYAAEKLLTQMEQAGIHTAVISLGGNVGLLGEKSDGSDWVVAVEKPDGSGDAIGELSIAGGENTYVVTSGAYQRYFEEDGVRYHHILHPETGYPAETDLQSVTIVSHSGTEADGLSTALFVMGLDKAVEFWRSGVYSFDMVLITEDNIYVTPGLDFSGTLPVIPLEAEP